MVLEGLMIDGEGIKLSYVYQININLYQICQNSIYIEGNTNYNHNFQPFIFNYINHSNYILPIQRPKTLNKKFINNIRMVRRNGYENKP